MIHGSSNDPVLIKKIHLKIWALRDELESVISKVIAQKGGERELSHEEIQSIRDEYSFSQKNETKPTLTLIKGGQESPSQESKENSDDDEEDLEAQMAAAMGTTPEEEPEKQPEKQSEEEQENGGATEEEDEDLEAAMAAALEGKGPSSPSQSSPEEASPSGEKKIVIQRGSHNIPSEKIKRGIAVLSEMSMNKIFFFSSCKFTEGQSIVIEFQVPKRFVLNAKIFYCRPFNMSSRIISSKKVDYRTVAQFTFLKEGERTLLREFIQSIEPEIPEVVADSPKEKKNENSDDFDGLDGLDF